MAGRGWRGGEGIKRLLRLIRGASSFEGILFIIWESPKVMDRVTGCFLEKCRRALKVMEYCNNLHLK